MITIQQIKAARALLNWKQRDLAKISGVSLPTVTQIELGHGNPRKKTMAIIQQAFESYGITFLGSHGLDLRQEQFSVEVLHGKEGVFKMWADIESVFSDGNGGEVLLSSLDERLFLKFFPDEMKEILHRRDKLKIVTRGLISETDNFLVMPIEWYRAIPKILFTQIPHFIYKDRMGILNLDDSPRLILIKNRPLADAFRKQFEFNWSLGKRLIRKKPFCGSYKINAT